MYNKVKDIFHASLSDTSFINGGLEYPRYKELDVYPLGCESEIVKLPKEYQLLEYVENTTQISNKNDNWSILEFDYYPRRNTSYVLECTYQDKGGAFIGTDKKYTIADSYSMIQNSIDIDGNNQLSLNHYNYQISTKKETNKVINTPLIIGEHYIFDITTGVYSLRNIHNNVVLSYNGNTTGSYFSDTDDGSRNLKLGKSCGKIYKVKVLTDGILDIFLVPVRHRTLNIFGLYDIINNKLYQYNGFVPGNDVKRIESSIG